MKTNKSQTQCPKKFGHLCISFGHFRLTGTNFAEIRGEYTTYLVFALALRGDDCAAHRGAVTTPRRLLAARQGWVTTPGANAPPLLNQEGSFWWALNAA